MRAAFLILVAMVVAGVSSAVAQDKKVKIGRFEVDGKVVKPKYKVYIVTASKKIYNAKTDETGFVVPAEALANKDEFVGVVIKFDKHVLEIFTNDPSKFDVDWLVVGVDTEPFEAENIGDSDPAGIQTAYFVEFGGEPGTRLTVKKSKSQITKKTNE